MTEECDVEGGGVFMHKGITKLKSGSYVIIIGSNWQDDEDYAYVVTDKEALDEIVNSYNLQLLEKGRFKRLRELYEKTMLIEDDEDEEDEDE